MMNEKEEKREVAMSEEIESIPMHQSVINYEDCVRSALLHCNKSEIKLAQRLKIDPISLARWVIDEEPGLTLEEVDRIAAEIGVSVSTSISLPH